MKAQRTKAKNAALAYAYGVVKKKGAKPAPVVPLERALAWLRRGQPIRRRAWHPESRIFRLGGDVFVKLPSAYRLEPQLWRPYPQDVLATDWEKAR